MSTASTDPERPRPHGAPVPNHHASHPGFSGFSGLVAAVSFLSGRDHAAALAVELAALEPGDRLVDIGCGPGVAARRARDLGAAVIGVDPASVMLRVARLRWRSSADLQWRVGTAESLPVDAGSVDVVWSLSTVHHWADVDAGLAEIERVLVTGGRLVVTERRIEDMDATGTASHGWITAQAEAFADICRRRGWADATVSMHPGTGTGELLAVSARRAMAGEEASDAVAR